MSKNAGIDEHKADTALIKEAYKEYCKVIRTGKHGLVKLISERDALDRWVGKVNERI